MIEVPSKIIISGDREAGKALIGDGHRQMAILENLMSFNDLDQYSIKMSPYPGAMITCKKVFGLRTIEIVTGVPGGKERKDGQMCLCNCNFTVGFIAALGEKLDDRGAQLYDVIACFRKKTYRMYRDVLASDFTKYEVGQKVLLIPYYQMSFLCCQEESVATGCVPRKSDDDISEDAWRSTLRIVPWHAERLPKYIKVQANG